MNKKLLISLSTLLLLSTANANEAELKEEASKAIKTVAGALQTTLMKKIKEEGFPKAALFCSTNATALAKEASKNLDKTIKLKRITDKPRNEKAQATKEQLAVFEEIKTKLAKGQKVEMLVKEISSNHYQVYKPIKIKKPCLNCHGDEATRNKQAYEAISKNYPNDKAIGYKLGDFRGAFLVDIIR